MHEYQPLKVPGKNVTKLQNTRDPVFLSIEYAIALGMTTFAIWTLAVHLSVLLQQNLSFATYTFTALLALFFGLVWAFRSRLPSLEPPFELIKVAKQSPVVSLTMAAIGGLIILLLKFESYNVFWFFATLFMVFGLVFLRRSSEVLEQGRPDWLRLESDRTAILFILLCCVAAIIFQLISQRSDADDSVYLGFIRGVLDYPQVALSSRDMMLGVDDMPLLISVYQVHSYELLVAAVSQLFSLDLMFVYYLLLPSVLSAMTVLVWSVVLRQFLGQRWILGLASFLLLTFFLGEAHRSFGNFAFNRMFHGKTFLVIAIVPLIYYYVLKCLRNHDRGALLPLAFTQIAAVGFTSTALYVMPMVTGLAILGSIACWRTIGKQEILSVCKVAATLIYPVAIALFFKFSGLSLDVDEGRLVEMAWVLDFAFGQEQKYLVMMGLLLLFVFPAYRETRLFLGTAIVVFFLLPINPLFYQLFADNITSVHTFWRIFWILPVGLCLTVLTASLISSVTNGRAAQIGAFVLLVLAMAFTWGNFNVLRYGVGYPGPKLGADYSLLETVAELTPPESSILAHESVAAWMTVVPDHPPLVYSRELYIKFFNNTPGTYSARTLRETREMIELVNRNQAEAGQAERLEYLIDEYGLGTLVFRARAMDQITDLMLAEKGFTRKTLDEYVVWHR